jgi:RNA recognition motif-containing protein
MELVKLFVGGFPLEIDELELAKLFAPHGDISTIKIVRY